MNHPSHAEVLNKIKTRFREETFTRESIQEVIHTYPDLVSCRHSTFAQAQIRMLYINFAMIHCKLSPSLPNRAHSQIPRRTKHPI